MICRHRRLSEEVAGGLRSADVLPRRVAVSRRATSVCREHDAAVVVRTPDVSAGRWRAAAVTEVRLQSVRVQREQVGGGVGQSTSRGRQTRTGRRGSHAGASPLPGPGPTVSQVSTGPAPSAGVYPCAGSATAVDGTTDAVASHPPLPYVSPARQTHVIVVVIAQFVATADVLVVGRRAQHIVVRRPATGDATVVVAPVLVHHALLSARTAVGGAAVFAEAIQMFVVGIVIILQIVDDLPLVVLALRMATPGRVE